VVEVLLSIIEVGRFIGFIARLMFNNVALSRRRALFFKDETNAVPLNHLRSSLFAPFLSSLSSSAPRRATSDDRVDLGWTMMIL
jgi:hypothetical protein